MSKPSKPIAITMGCPAGIGPEIILKLFSDQQTLFAHPGIVIIGDKAILEATACSYNMHINMVLWEPGMEVVQGCLNVLSETMLDPKVIDSGRPSAEAGMASYRYIIKAIDLCIANEVTAIVTCPISKAALNLAGISFPGHTEILAEKTGSSDFAMMMAGERLKVALATTHIALRDVPVKLSSQRIAKVIELTDHAMKSLFGIFTPKIAVCGLNPHAGEGGMFGDEEGRIILPAVQQAKAQGMDVTGPLPPDTVFYHAFHSRFDAVVCMYHDQGLGPFKLVHFDDGVNVTLGIPVLRTSVDHGTAYDIVGKNLARTTSLAAAVRLATGVRQISP